jgi:hypothetical protein
MTTAIVRWCWKRVRVERGPSGGGPRALTQEEYRALRFALDLVDRLGAEHGFDPAELVNPRTGEPFGACIERMRRRAAGGDAALR